MKAGILTRLKRLNLFKLFSKEESNAVSQNTAVPPNRIEELRQLKFFAKIYLDFYTERQCHPENDWQRKLSNRNITLLKGIINKLNKLQHQDKIAQYLAALKPTTTLSTNATEKEKKKLYDNQLENFNIIFTQGVPFFLMMEINRCSPFMSYVNDLTWFKLGTIGEHMEFGSGKADGTVFEKYLPYQMKVLAEAKETFFNIEPYSDDYTLLDSALTLISLDNYSSANVLIITLTEGLLRKFCVQLYKKQYPESSDKDADFFVYHRNSSVQVLLKNSIWKKDIPVLFSDFLTEYKHTDNPTVNTFEEKFKTHQQANERLTKKAIQAQKIISNHLQQPISSNEEFSISIQKLMDEMSEEAKNLMNEEDKIVMIGIDTYFDFLAKKLKEDRNNIIHGKYSLFNEKWKTLVYLAALDTLINKIVWYNMNVASACKSEEII